MFAQLLTALSLKNTDSAWQSILSASRLSNLWKSSTGLLSNFYSNVTIGSALQKLGFWVVVILFACLPLPSFTNDKEGLAIILLASAAIWLLGTILGGKERPNTNTIDLLIIAYAGINLIAAASSHYFGESLRGLAKVYVYLIGYFLFSAQISNNWRRRMVLVGVLLGVSTLVSIYGLYQYKIGVAPLATWEDPSIEDKATRIYATLNNPNLLAGYLVPIVPLAGALAMGALARQKWLLSLVPLSIFGLTALATVLTGSRGGYLGLFGGLAFLLLILGSFLWQRRPKLRPWLGTLIVLIPLSLLLAIHFAPTFEHRIMSIFAGREHSSNSYRLNVWLSSLSMFKDNWWIGVGVGNQAFRLAYGLYMRSGFDALGTYCVPLEVAVETGALGLCVFALLVIACLARAHLSFWAPQPTLHRYLTAGAAASLVGLMIHGLVDTVFYRPQVQFIFWLMIALLAKSGDANDEKA
ncbi:MAG: hypothetical protein C5B53_09215 [Candidatus Melainabacteria bacterium]|nr:MAG: hypothetical protein C5B53_09215 [Candidatus Melainabacteria bacterium]